MLRLHSDRPTDRTPIVDELAEPAGLALHGGDLFVADRSGSVFWILDDGQTVKPALEVATGLDGPEGLAVGDDGKTLFVSAYDRVYRIRP